MPYRETNDGAEPEEESCVLPFNLLELEARLLAAQAAKAEYDLRPEFVAGDYLLAIYKVHLGAQKSRLQIQTTVMAPAPYIGRDLFEICGIGRVLGAEMCLSILSACYPDPQKRHELLVACHGYFDMSTLVGCQYWATVELKSGYVFVVKRRGI